MNETVTHYKLAGTGTTVTTNPAQVLAAVDGIPVVHCAATVDRTGAFRRWRTRPKPR